MQSAQFAFCMEAILSSYLQSHKIFIASKHWTSIVQCVSYTVWILICLPEVKTWVIMSHYANYTFFSLSLHDLAPNFQVCFQGEICKKCPSIFTKPQFLCSLDWKWQCGSARMERNLLRRRKCQSQKINTAIPCCMEKYISNGVCYMLYSVASLRGKNIMFKTSF